ncbi:MAG: hypothetical protein WBE38_02825 [Terracidiphilus sp.]|jgi:hypothetical protein
MRWIIRVILLPLAWVAALHAYQDCRQVLNSYGYMDNNGQERIIQCRPFDCERALEVSKEISLHYPALADSAGEMQDEVNEYQGYTFAWGALAALLLAGIGFSFVRRKRAREEEPEAHPPNPESVGS